MNRAEEEFDFAGEAREFAERVGDTVERCLAGETLSNDISVKSDKARVVIQFVHELVVVDSSVSGVHETIGYLGVEYHLGLDGVGEHLAVDKSNFRLSLKSSGSGPILRIDYDRPAAEWSKPGAHIQIHAHSGPFTRLLAEAGHESSHAIESLHIPTGGHRFRPCLEDFLQFLITECGVGSRDGWKEIVRERREEWRAKQTRAAVRDRPDAAISELTRLGYSVTGRPTTTYTSRVATRW